MRCSCYHGDMHAYFLRMRRQPVALLFINKVGGSKRGLSIRLSGIFTYPACFWNQGVRIIEVLLYTLMFTDTCTCRSRILGTRIVCKTVDTTYIAEWGPQCYPVPAWLLSQRELAFQWCSLSRVSGPNAHKQTPG